MKYAILSDLHANRDALERVLSDARACGAEVVICLGDIVGYGPLPAETLARIRSVASVVIAGNHDDAVSGRSDAKDFIDLAGDAVDRHRNVLSRDDIAWLRSLPHTAVVEGAALTHGDLTAPEDFRYVDSEDAAAENFAATDADLVFIGHTHVPGLYLTGASGRVYQLDPEDFVLEDGKRYIVNVGSVGYPRESNGKCFSSYVLYDSEERTVHFRALPFAVSSVLQRGRTGRRRNRLIILALAVLAVTLGIVFSVLDKRGETSIVVKPLAERSVELTATSRGVRANLTLAPRSPAAQLSVFFTCASNRCGFVSERVSKKCSRRFPVPRGATKAVISVQPAEGSGAKPVILNFAPAAE